MTLKEMIYQKIVEGERICSYKIYGEFWYVVKWNKQIYVHYTRRTSFNKLKYLWYLSANETPARFRCQTQELQIETMLKK